MFAVGCLVATIVAFCAAALSALQRWAILDAKFKVRMKMFDDLHTAFVQKSEANTGRYVCITQKGYVVWTPPWAGPGDQICLLKGSKIPFLIRKVEQASPSGLESYELVGDCYVHGLM